MRGKTWAKVAMGLRQASEQILTLEEKYHAEYRSGRYAGLLGLNNVLHHLLAYPITLLKRAYGLTSINRGRAADAVATVIAASGVKLNYLTKYDGVRGWWVRAGDAFVTFDPTGAGYRDVDHGLPAPGAVVGSSPSQYFIHGSEIFVPETVADLWGTASKGLRPYLWSHPAMLLRRVGHEVDDRLALEPMTTPPAENVGCPSAEDVLANIIPGTPQVVLLVGPSGAGKSSLARRVAASLGGRTLFLDRSNWSHGTAMLDQVAILIRLLAPDVTVLDDVDMRDHATVTAMLDALEPLRAAGSLAIITMMADDITEENSRRPGALYFPGMRPGRVDAVMYVPRPDEAQRKAILTAYLPKDYAHTDALAKGTEGLTGAYLKRLAEMVTAYPSRPWESVLEALRVTAPCRREV